MGSDWSSEKVATSNIQALCNNVKYYVVHAIENTIVNEYIARKYISKDEGSAHLFIVKIKVNEDGDGFIHVKLKAENGLATFEDLRQHMTADDEIKPF